ncbi:hypothetical protein N9H99_05240, partial [Planktomarina temperata]|nr:hypothetical protein [Planktomarina temperata]
VIGGAAVDTVDGGAGDDNITAGEGADLITGGTGADTINLTEATVAIDTVFFAAVGEGSTAAASGAQFSGFDVVTGFGSTDLVDVNAITVLAAEGEVLLSTAGSTAAIDLADSEYTDVDAIVTFLNDAGSVFDNGGGGDSYAVAITFSNFSAIYGIADAGVVDTVEATEVTLLGTVDAVILAANMDFIT